MDEPDADGRGPVPGGTLERVAALCAAAVPGAGVDAGAVTILSLREAPTVLHATDALAASLEDLQFTLGEGPCLDATRAGSPVLVADLTDPSEGVAARWPAFLDEARRAGLRAVFAFPVRMGAISLGRLGLYRSSAGRLAPDQLRLALATTDRVGECLLDLGAAQVDGIPSSAYRMTVHQAAGMVMVQLGVTIEDALARLRATSYAEAISINTLSADVVRGRRRFAEEQEWTP